MSTETTTRRVTTYAVQDARHWSHDPAADLHTMDTLAEAQTIARALSLTTGNAHRIVARPGNAHYEHTAFSVVGEMSPAATWKNATSTDAIAYLNEHIGHYWFSKETLRFFKSKIYGPVYGTEYGRFLFISSEKRDDERRKFTIREMEPDGSIETVGEFQAYGTYKAAEKAIRELLAQ